MSYSNRPQYGQQPHYPAGDFEASYGNSFAETIPPPPRSPSYAPRGNSQGAYGSHPSYPGQLPVQTGPFRPVSGSNYPPPHTGRPVPAPPHSLAPVSMGSARGVMATGPQISQHGMEAPARPSAKAGMSILFAGAIIGGLIGAVMHARQNAADAFASAAPTHEVATDAMGSGPTPPSSAPAPSEKKLDANSRLTDDAKDAKDAKADKSKSKTKITWKARGETPKGLTTTTANADKNTFSDTDDTDPTPAPVAKGKGGGKAAKASNKDDDGYTIASAGGGDSDTTGDSKPTKVADAKPSKKTDKTVPAIAEPAPAPPKKSSAAKGGGDDAVSVLKAAMGATENSL